MIVHGTHDFGAIYSCRCIIHDQWYWFQPSFRTRDSSFCDSQTDSISRRLEKDQYLLSKPKWKKVVMNASSGVFYIYRGNFTLIAVLFLIFKWDHSSASINYKFSAIKLFDFRPFQLTVAANKNIWTNVLLINSEMRNSQNFYRPNERTKTKGK